MRIFSSSILQFLTFACLGSACSLAGEPPGGKAGGRPGGQACAAYGAGFVGLAGSDTCVRIGGHVRVEYGWGAGSARSGSNYGATTQASPPLFGDPAVNSTAPVLPFAHLRAAGLAGQGAGRR